MAYGDDAACYKAPTTDCLLEMTLEAAQSIEDERRKWSTLARVARVQARIGDFDAVSKTLRKITNDEERNQALDGVAISRAERGNTSDAIEDAQKIENKYVRAFAFERIADVRDEAGDRDGMWATINAITDAKARDLTYGNLVRRRIDQGRFAEAAEFAEKLQDPFEKTTSFVMIGFVGISVSGSDEKQMRQLLSRGFAMLPDLQDTKSRDRIIEKLAPLAVKAGVIGESVKSVDLMENQTARIATSYTVAIALATRGEKDQASTLVGKADALIAGLDPMERDAEQLAITGVKSAYYELLGEAARAKELRAEVISALSAMDDKKQRAKASSGLVGIYALAGLAPLASELAAGLSDDRQKARAFDRILGYFSALGDIEDMLAIAAAIKDAKFDGYETKLGGLAIDLARNGRLSGRQQDLDAALKAAELIEAPSRRGYYIGHVGEAQFALGDKTRAKALLEQAVALGAQSEDQEWVADVLQELADFQVKIGQRAAALNTLRQGLSSARRIEDDRKREGELAVYADSFAQAGDVVAAAQLAKEVKDPARRADIFLDTAAALAQANP